jgi:hypothetical protein
VIGDQQDIAPFLPGKSGCVLGISRWRGIQVVGDAYGWSQRAALPYVQHPSTEVNVAQLTDVTKCCLIAGVRMRNVAVLGCLRMNVLY